MYIQPTSEAEAGIAATAAGPTAGRVLDAHELRQIALEALPLDDQRLREWKVWMVFWAAAAKDLDLAALNRQRYAEWQGLIRRLTAELPPTEANDFKADELISLIDGLGLRITLNPDKANRHMAVSMIDRWLESAFHQ